MAHPSTPLLWRWLKGFPRFLPRRTETLPATQPAQQASRTKGEYAGEQHNRGEKEWIRKVILCDEIAVLRPYRRSDGVVFGIKGVVEMRIIQRYAVGDAPRFIRLVLLLITPAKYQLADVTRTQSRRLFGRQLAFDHGLTLTAMGHELSHDLGVLA